MSDIKSPMSPPPAFQPSNSAYAPQAYPQTTPQYAQQPQQQQYFPDQQQQQGEYYVQQTEQYPHQPDHYAQHQQQQYAQPQQQQQQQPREAPPPQQSQYLSATPIPSLTRGPAPVDCPVCGQRALTTQTFESGSNTHLWAGILCLFACLGCIPYMINSFKDVTHKCGACGTLLATWHRNNGGVDVLAHARGPAAAPMQQQQQQAYQMQ